MNSETNTMKLQCYAKGCNEADTNKFSINNTRASGYQTHCKQCAKKYKAEHYQKNKEKITKYHKEYYTKNLDKRKAKSAVSAALKKGELERPSKCERCDTPCKPEGHHENYDPTQWLVIMWVCVPCHRRVHNGEPLKIGGTELSKQFKG